MPAAVDEALGHRCAMAQAPPEERRARSPTVRLATARCLLPAADAAMIGAVLFLPFGRRLDAASLAEPVEAILGGAAAKLRAALVQAEAF